MILETFKICICLYLYAATIALIGLVLGLTIKLLIEVFKGDL